MYLAYAYRKTDKIIVAKINNLQGIDENKLIGESQQFVGSELYDFVVLNNDTINKKIGDTIDLTGLVDVRDEVMLSENMYLRKALKDTQDELSKTKNQLNNANQQIANLNQSSVYYGDTLDSILFTVLPSINPKQ